MSCYRKQELVELRGADSANKINGPEPIYYNCYKINKIKRNLFCYKGLVDNEYCNFKIGTGSDVTILNEKLVKGPRRQFEINECFLKYPTGEIVPVHFKVIVRMELGKYSLDVPMLVASISDDCILGTDFLESINLEKVFEPIFENTVLCK